MIWVNSVGYRAPTASRRDMSRASTQAQACVAADPEVEPNLFVLTRWSSRPTARSGSSNVNRWLLRWQVRRRACVARHSGGRQLRLHAHSRRGRGSLDETDGDLLLRRRVHRVPRRAGAHGAAGRRPFCRRADLVAVLAQRLLERKRDESEHRPNPPWRRLRSSSARRSIRDGNPPRSRPCRARCSATSGSWPGLDRPRPAGARGAAFLQRLTGAPRQGDDGPLRRAPRRPTCICSAASDLARCRRTRRDSTSGSIRFPSAKSTLNANPLKVREYLAAGLPVVSTRIPEVEVLGQCAIAGDAQESSAASRTCSSIRDPTRGAARPCAGRAGRHASRSCGPTWPASKPAESCLGRWRLPHPRCASSMSSTRGVRRARARGRGPGQGPAYRWSPSDRVQPQRHRRAQRVAASRRPRGRGAQARGPIWACSRPCAATHGRGSRRRARAQLVPNYHAAAGADGIGASAGVGVHLPRHGHAPGRPQVAHVVSRCH